MNSKNCSGNKLNNLLVFASIAILLFVGCIVGFGPFKSTEGFDFSTLLYGLLLPLVFIVGMFTTEVIKPKHLILAIGLITAVITLISLIATWVEYGPLYRLIYKETPFYYFDGSRYNVLEETLWLSSFKFVEASPEYVGMFGVLCGVFLPGSFFFDRKSKKIEFILSLVIGSIGVLQLITLPIIGGIIILAIVSLLFLLFKFFNKNKIVIKTVKITFLVLFGLAVAFLITAYINARGGFVFGGVLAKVFVSNPIMKNVSEILKYTKPTVDGKVITIFGANTAYYDLAEVEKALVIKSGIFEVELIKEIGIVGVLLVLVFIVLVFFEVIKAVESDKNTMFEKFAFTAVLLGFFIYNSLFFDQIPFIFDGSYSYFLRSLPTLVIVFLIGTICGLPKFKGDNTYEKE